MWESFITNSIISIKKVFIESFYVVFFNPFFLAETFLPEITPDTFT